MPVDLSVVIPLYNERENLETVVERILALNAGLDVLVVDDSSPDGTGALADELARGEPIVKVGLIRHVADQRFDTLGLTDHIESGDANAS